MLIFHLGSCFFESFKGLYVEIKCNTNQDIREVVDLISNASFFEVFGISR